MKRILGLIVLLVLTAVGLFWPVFGQLAESTSTTNGSDPVTFTRYRADLAIADDGLLTARETITANFPLPRHGIFQFWDVKDSSDSHNRYIPTITSITMDGKPVPYEVSKTGGDRYVVAKIGNPDEYVDFGDHTYVIDYTIPGAISPGTAGTGNYESNEGDVSGTAPSDLYWNVVAPGWLNDITKADIHITLPSEALGVQCTAGTGFGLSAGRGPCGIEGTGTRTVTLTANDIPAQSGMTVRIPMAMTPPPRMSVPWPVLFDKVLGTTLLPALFVGLLSLVGLALGIAWSASTRESAPGLPVMYAPPEGFGPVQTVYIAQEDTGGKALIATLLHMADRGLVKLDHRTDDTWLVTGQATADQWLAADPADRAAGSALGVMATQGSWFLADGSKDAGESLLDAQKSIDKEVQSWSLAAGFVSKDKGARLGCSVWGLLAIAAIIGFIGWRWPTMWGLPFAAFAIGGSELLNPKAMTRRTDTGRRAWSESGGFKRMLETPSSEERFDFSARKDLFIPYIPFAVAFGVADKWAAKYRVETGQEPPVPLWYPIGVGYAYSSLYDGNAGFSSFDSSLNSAISSYQASQSSSSGGGGGSFGGGGGGGGGGSW
ncbi:MAG: DUF2207 domain-containing protein [Actinobacteria bacterium]|nr:DUF2207 domain-containing protein [Actinomycetota bacterium]